jgi:hypothetical protein
MIRKLRAFAGNRSILMQIGAVFLLCQIVAQIAVMAFIVWRFERPEALRGLPAPFTETLAIDRMLMAASPDERAVVARLALATRPDLRRSAFSPRWRLPRPRALASRPGRRGRARPASR